MQFVYLCIQKVLPIFGLMIGSVEERSNKVKWIGISARSVGFMVMSTVNPKLDAFVHCCNTNWNRLSSNATVTHILRMCLFLRANRMNKSIWFCFWQNEAVTRPSTIKTSLRWNYVRCSSIKSNCYKWRFRIVADKRNKLHNTTISICGFSSVSIHTEPFVQ